MTFSDWLLSLSLSFIISYFSWLSWSSDRIFLYILWDLFPSNPREPLTLSISPRTGEVRQSASTFEVSKFASQSVRSKSVSQFASTFASS